MYTYTFIYTFTHTYKNLYIADIYTHKCMNACNYRFLRTYIHILLHIHI